MACTRARTHAYTHNVYTIHDRTHSIGSKSTEDATVYEEKDKAFYLDLERDPSNKKLLISASKSLRAGKVPAWIRSPAG